MILLSRLRYNRRKSGYHIGEYKKKYRLIRMISAELFFIGLIFTAINFYLQFYYMAFLLLAASGVTLLNLLLLRKHITLTVCGHIVNLVCFCVVALGNLWLGGISSSYISWFYVVPVIAAATTGLFGLLSYSFLCVSLLMFYNFSHFPAWYVLPENYMPFILMINHLFIPAILLTILYNFISENKRYENLLMEKNYLLNADKQKFHYLSNHDSLTNLPNRFAFNTYLQKLIESADPQKDVIILYYIDLNGFKKINDLYGHGVGDILLFQAARRLQSCFRALDFVARIGGDEFTAIVHQQVSNDFENLLLTRIEQRFSEPFPINNMEIRCDLSIGSARYSTDAKNLHTLQKIADEAMYANKKKRALMQKP